jgi:tRNA pseudouridine-54 N-methylase
LRGQDELSRFHPTPNTTRFFCPHCGCFLLTDHVPLPRNLRKSLLRRGVEPVSLGPVMLRASQCVVLVLNEYDRLYSAR